MRFSFVFVALAHSAHFIFNNIISPILFTVYVDELIARLQASGLGCNNGRSYIGVLGYADDLALLSPSVYALSKMVGICEEYAKKYDIGSNRQNAIAIESEAGDSLT